MKLSEIQLVPEIQALFQENNEYEAIKADIAERGIQDPVKVNQQNQLLAGYTRFRIAQELALDEVPHVVVDVDSDMNVMIEYAILDNILPMSMLNKTESRFRFGHAKTISYLCRC